MSLCGFTSIRPPVYIPSMGRPRGSRNKITGLDKFPSRYVVDEETGCWNWKKFGESYTSERRAAHGEKMKSYYTPEQRAAQSERIKEWWAARKKGK
jgi:hypothetical protein